MPTTIRASSMSSERKLVSKKQTTPNDTEEHLESNETLVYFKNLHNGIVAIQLAYMLSVILGSIAASRLLLLPQASYEGPAYHGLFLSLPWLLLTTWQTHSQSVFPPVVCS